MAVRLCTSRAMPQLVHICVAILVVKCGKILVLVVKWLGHSWGLQGPAQFSAEGYLIDWWVSKCLEYHSCGRVHSGRDSYQGTAGAEKGVGYGRGRVGTMGVGEWEWPIRLFPRAYVKTKLYGI